MSTSSIIPPNIAAGQPTLVNMVTRGIKALFHKDKQSKQLQSWIEISPYGFISSNYIQYIAGRLSSCKFSLVDNGCTVVRFPNGGQIVQAPSGHIVELDNRRRVILVRVTKSEAEDAKQAFGNNNDELSESFQASINKSGRSIVIMPGNIVILEDKEKVTITFPDGTEFFAKKNFELALA